MTYQMAYGDGDWLTQWQREEALRDR
jgi:hypothetical protein